MRFQPKSKEEAERGPLLPDGEYEAVVHEAEDTESKKGNEMLKLTLDVYGPDGERVRVWDYLLDQFSFKLYHFCESAGLLDKYNTGVLVDADCVGARVMAKIATQEGEGSYPDRNVVVDYVGSVGADTPAPGKGEVTITPDDIPF